MKRRDFLKLTALIAPLPSSGRLFAMPSGTPRFLLVFLRGGYDCANVVIPYSSAYYYEARPNIAMLDYVTCFASMANSYIVSLHMAMKVRCVTSYGVGIPCRLDGIPLQLARSLAALLNRFLMFRRIPNIRLAITLE